MNRTLLSVVLPAYNEQEVLPLTVQRFAAMRAPLAELGVELELVFVNDGSRDRTGDLLEEYARTEPGVRVANLTRNFGHQAAVTAGLSLAEGDAVVVMDCDLQDPPELLPRLIERWREGYHVVYGVRRKRKEWFGKRFAYWLFYRTLARISDLDIPLDSGDFCLMDRSVIELLEQMPERQRFVRGLRTWVGLRQTGVEYERPARAAGEPAYTLRALVKLAMDGLVSFSYVPLRLVTRLGMLSAVLAVAMGAWVVWSVLTGQPMPRGWASLACLVLLVAAVQLVSLGIIGEYLARVFLEVKRRPTYLIASVFGSDSGWHNAPEVRWQGRAHRGTPPSSRVVDHASS
ncbi:MAG TPA: glycosyltransferase family 2 protein [Gemmatimonadaceae bacterium]|nr:glycosyltransferase family 2 protein [Gemmatimonadaceae bacterium]